MGARSIIGSMSLGAYYSEAPHKRDAVLRWMQEASDEVVADMLVFGRWIKWRGRMYFMTIKPALGKGD